MKTFIAAALLGGSLLISDATAAPAQTTVLVHRGTLVAGQLQQTLDSKTAHDNDTFTLIEKDTFFHKNPALHGGTIEGHVEDVTPASATHKATMNVIFDDVRLPDGTVAPIHVKITSITLFAPKTHHIRDAALILGGAVGGHILSKKTGHHGGTLAGAAAGFALASSLKSNIVVRRGTLIKMRVLDDVIPGATGA
jgi:hypothetical protein